MVHKKEKIYIDMTMLCSKNGTISPIAFAWKDGTMYHIECVGKTNMENRRQRQEYIQI